MDSTTTSQRDDHDGDGDVQAEGTAQSTTETPSSQAAFNQEVIASLLSDEFTDKFNIELDELPKGDYRRAKSLFIIGGQYNLYYTRTASPILLDKAISYTERALDELPKLHVKLKEYVAVYTHLLQQKVEKSNGLEVAERLEVANRYILGLELGIGYLDECSLKEEKMRELGCAYLSRFGESNNVEDLMLAIETLEACAEDLEKTYPQAATYLGSALCQHYDYDKSLNSLERSMDLLQKGLEAIPKDQGHYAPLRAYGLGVLTSVCAKINDNPCSGELRSRAINIVEIVLSSTYPESEGVSRLKGQHLKLVMMQFFKEPESEQDLLDALEFGVNDKPADNQDNVAFEKMPLTINRLFTLSPLPDSKKNIRLVKLLPGTKENVIRCEILVEHLSSALHYEALSYMWGSPKGTEEICVNGCLHKVTKNLYSALLRLRHTGTARTLWIDALCINQTDLNEKRHQIGLMRDIYQSASTVIMWLGEPKSEEEPFAPNQISDKRLTLSTGERKVESDKAEVDSKEGLRALENPQVHKLVSDAHVPPLSSDQPVEPREWEVLMEKATSLRPVLFGRKPVSKISHEGFLGFMSMMERVLKRVEQKQRVYLLYHNVRIRRFLGPELHIFDWTTPDNIISFFRSPQSASMWPTLGAFALIHSFAQFMHFSQLPFFGGTDEDLSYPSTQTWIKSASALDSILSSDYWQRAWILQEVVLAQKPIVHYGPHIMHLDVLLQASYAFEFHYKQCCSKWGDKAYRKTHTYWTQLESGFKKFDKLHQLRRAHGVPSMVSTDSPSSKPSLHNAAASKPNASLSLSSIMRTGISERKATDPRDLVYGILGLVDSDTGIEADYTASLAEVFTRAAAQMTLEEQSLQVLILNDLGKHAKHGLPSWVPDWTSSGMFCPQPYLGSLYKTDKGRHYYAEIEDGLKLKVRSVKVDTIKRVSKMRTASWDEPVKLVGLLKEWRSMAGLDSPNQLEVHDHAELEDTFWRAVFADAISEHDMKHQPPDDQEESRDRERRFEVRDLAKVRAWWDWLQREMDSSVISPEMEWHSLRTRSHPDGFHIVTDSFWQTTETRKMIFTENGRMGTGPSEFGNYIEFGDARVEDEVHVLFGLNVPVILRVLEEGDNQPRAAGTKRYTFVGPCYLHGIMDGDVVENGDEGVEEILLC